MTLLDFQAANAELKTQRAATQHWYSQYVRLRNHIQNANLVIDMTDQSMSPQVCPHRENHRNIDFCDTCYFES